MECRNQDRRRIRPDAGDLRDRRHDLVRERRPADPRRGARRAHPRGVDAARVSCSPACRMPKPATRLRDHGHRPLSAALHHGSRPKRKRIASGCWSSSAKTRASRRQVASLERPISDRLGVLEETIDARRDRDFAAAQQVFVTGRGTRAMDEIRRVVQQMTHGGGRSARRACRDRADGRAQCAVDDRVRHPRSARDRRNRWASHHAQHRAFRSAA